MSSINLLDLPNELLTLFSLECSTSRDINMLAKSCRQLNSIAFPVLLQRLGLPLDNGRTICAIDFSKKEVPTTLVAWRIYFQQASLKHFICILSDIFVLSPYLESTSSEVTYTDEDGQTLIKRLDSITHLVKHALSIESLFVLLDASSIELTTSCGHIRVRHVMQIAAQFLRISIQKNCNSFQIIDPFAIIYSPHDQVQHSYLRKARKSGIKQKLTAFKTTVSNFMHYFSRWPISKGTTGRTPVRCRFKWEESYPQLRFSPPILPEIQVVGNRLSKINLSSMFLLAEPHLSETLRILKNSSIKSLTLGSPRLRTIEEFTHVILPSVIESLPHLEEIYYGFRYVEELLEYLPRLQRLRRLTLSSFVSQRLPWMEALPQAGKILPNLNSITGSLAQITYILSVATELPVLRFLNVLIDGFHHYKDDLSTISLQFERLNERLEKLGIHPCISICSSYLRIEQTNLEWNRKNFARVTHLTTQLSYLTNSDKIIITDDVRTHELGLELNQALIWLSTLRNLQDFTVVIHLSSLITGKYPTELSSAIDTIMKQAAKLNLNTSIVYEYNIRGHQHWSTCRSKSDTRFYDDPFMKVKYGQEYVCSSF